MKLVLATALALAITVLPARATTICTLVADAATSAVLLEQGDCTTRVTPASTFKLTLALMGFDAGVLADAHDPVLPFEPGYPDWGGDAWRQPTDPAHWMEHSVVWYSQQVARALGVDALTRYAEAFGYGDADFAGDPGKDNALERAWISSSLEISPREQAVFLARLVNGQLPISAHARAMTMAIVQSATVDGWTIAGKTGSAFPRLADGNLDRAHGWGWYVGWATRNDTTLVFARLTQNDGTIPNHGGNWTRDTVLADWPHLVE